MTDICRVCLNSGELVSLFESHESVQLSEKMMSCASIRVAPEDDLPSTICLRCRDRLIASYSFRIQCEHSDSKLRKRYVDSMTYSDGLCCIKDERNGEEYISTIKCELDYNGFDSDCPSDNNYGIDIIKTECQNSASLKVEDNVIVKKIYRKRDIKKKQHPKKSSKKVKQKDKTPTLHLDISGEIEKFGSPDEDSLSYSGNHSNEVKEDKREAQQPSHHIKCETSIEHDETLLSSLIESRPKRIRIRKSGKKTKKSSKPHKEQCFTCGKVMSSRFRLKMHMRIHTGEKPFACSVCNKTFALSQNLKVHERVHTGEKPLLCGTCGKAFAQSAGLVAHMRLHTGETPYRCSLCPMSFRTPGHLQYHIRQHTGEKNFECQNCHRAFITRGDLTQHTKTHTGERPYVCTICGLRMSRSSHLSRHMMTHTGEKPHKCNVCGSSYAQKGDLVRHTKKHALGPCKLSLMNQEHRLDPLNKQSTTEHNKPFNQIILVDRNIVIENKIISTEDEPVKLEVDDKNPKPRTIDLTFGLGLISPHIT